MLCADVRDPGNAGTVIRTADAMGAAAVLLAGSSVDAYNPKTVRASVGSLFHLPLSVVSDAPSAVDAARAAGLTVLAADGAGEVDLDEADELLAGPVAWLFGNEARGLPADLAAAADHRVRIPLQRPRREPQPLHRRRRVPLCHRPGTAARALWVAPRQSRLRPAIEGEPEPLWRSVTRLATS